MDNVFEAGRRNSYQVIGRQHSLTGQLALLIDQVTHKTIRE